MPSECGLCGASYHNLPLNQQANICTYCALIFYIVAILGETPSIDTKRMKEVPNRWWEGDPEAWPKQIVP